MSIYVRLEEGELDPSAELDGLLRTANGDGAVVSFVGIARPQSKEGKSLTRLVLEHHPRLTLKSLDEIAGAALSKFEVTHVRVIHRSGEISPGKPIVFAAAASLHRRAAFEAADYLMDRLKTEAVFWKREEGELGTNWIEPTDADYTDRNRWE